MGSGDKSTKPQIEGNEDRGRPGEGRSGGGAGGGSGIPSGAPREGEGSAASKLKARWRGAERPRNFEISELAGCRSGRAV